MGVTFLAFADVDDAVVRDRACPWPTVEVLSGNDWC